MPYKKYHLFDVLEYGPIVAHDKESGMVITVNKVCFSQWTEVGQNHFIGGTSCLVTELERVGDCTDLGLVLDVAREWMKELLQTDGQEEPTNS